jgi:hypothetical protein
MNLLAGILGIVLGFGLFNNEAIDYVNIVCGVGNLLFYLYLNFPFTYKKPQDGERQ